ncbi:MAG: hypothetical protein HQ512_15110 [Rhodospirillales bacterium]|nr:hypothetical protein [Rhodospirillales bacterium]
MHDRNLRLGKPPPVSWVGARIAAHARHRELTDMLIDLALRTAVNFVGLFAKPERPRHKVPD